MLGLFQVLSNLSFTTTLGGRYNYPCFPDQRLKLREFKWLRQVAKPRFNPRFESDHTLRLAACFIYSVCSQGVDIRVISVNMMTEQLPDYEGSEQVLIPH